MPEDQYQKFMVEVAKIHQRMTDHYADEAKFKDEIRAKLDPMYQVFTQSKGWGVITIALMKFIGLLSVVVGAIYAAIHYLKSN